MSTAPAENQTSPAPFPAVQVEDIRKIFPPADGTSGEGTLALDGIRLDVQTGEFVSFVGPSGCGKSTLLRIIAGLTPATTGRVLVNGTPVTGPGTHVGFVFQDPNLFPWLTVRQNITFGPRLHASRREWADEADDLIRRIGLSGFADALPHHLSGGMAQRAALARAVLNRPPVLLLDEPLGALDAFTRMTMQDELRALIRRRGTTVILVTHDIDEALYLSDRIVIFTTRPGRLQEEIRIGSGFSRVRNAPEFVERRLRILETLHFAPAENETGSGDPLRYI
ncbi:MAG: ABC transporter ATP-binding protein [Puniceicoccales bacterium]|jgi:NitT/TauT family transport system ATP-binding protein/sulfonate transport system ATP-binding protein|nr:ABC transporter ATP-binding protein [Puniceicoccales bacterium]